MPGSVLVPKCRRMKVLLPHCTQFPFEFATVRYRKQAARMWLHWNVVMRKYEMNWWKVTPSITISNPAIFLIGAVFLEGQRNLRTSLQFLLHSMCGPGLFKRGLIANGLASYWRNASPCQLEPSTKLVHIIQLAVKLANRVTALKSQ